MKSDPLCARPDGTVYCCGRGDQEPLPADPNDVGFKSENCDGIVADLRQVCPDVLDFEAPPTRQACYLPWSNDNVPVIGPVPGHSGAYVAAGHGCWGILNGPATGLCAASLLLGRDPLIEMSPYSFDRLTRKR